MTSWGGRYRSKGMNQKVIGFSISYQRDVLLARGLGVEHLREMLLRLARPLLRQGASLAYGGHWKDVEDNFTYDLLRLISAEQEDNSAGGPDTNLTIGRLYNHSAWPYYLDITPQIEAQWINCCRIVRITQHDAGFNAGEIVPDEEAATKSKRVSFNAACTLSAMRRLMNEGGTIDIPDARSEIVPPVGVRVLLGGKTTGFSGFLPGIFEEALVTLEKTDRSLYLLGGFGGATEVLTRTILSNFSAAPAELTVGWHKSATPEYAGLVESLDEFRLPEQARDPATVFDQLWQKLLAARASPAEMLNTGLSDDQTRELMTTQDPLTAVRLVRAGLATKWGLQDLPA